MMSRRHFPDALQFLVALAELFWALLRLPFDWLRGDLRCPACNGAPERAEDCVLCGGEAQGGRHA